MVNIYPRAPMNPFLGIGLGAKRNPAATPKFITHHG